MHWVAFSILLYVATVLQTTVSPFFAVHTIRPDLLVIIAAHYALAARTPDALIACWLTGLAADLAGIGYERHAALGVHALALGLVGMFITAVRELTFRDSVITQLFFTFVIGFLQALLVGVHLTLSAANRPPFSAVVLSAFYGAIYTALLAPYVHWLLRKLKSPLGLGARRRVRVD